MTTIGDRLTALRKSKRLTQAELAEKLGLKHGAISAIEKNRTESTETLYAIADLFSVDRNWLITGKGVQPEGLVLELKSEPENPWKEATIAAMQSEIAFLREIVKQLTGKSAPTNFLKAVKNSSAPGAIVRVLTAKAA